MGRSYIKMILREFKKSFGRFAAIFGIVALGVGFLSGLLITTPDMNNSVDKYYDENNMADIFIKATMGLTLDDLDEVESHENVKDIMPAYVIDKLMRVDDSDLVTSRIYGIPLLDRENQTVINQLELLEGRMPENNRECLVERKSQYIKDIKVGSTLQLSDENKDYEDIDDLYEIDTYEVVGVVGNSFHFAIEREFSNIGSGNLDTIIYVDRSSYALEEFTDFYIVLEDALEMDSFSSEYQVYTEKVRKSLENLGEDRSKLRKESILDEANKKLKEGFEEYNEEKNKAEKELSDALEKINNGEKELEDSAIELEEAKIELEDARKTLKKETKAAERDIEEGEKELKQAKNEIIDGEKQLKEAKLELDKGQEDYLDGYREYLDGKKELEDAEKEINQAKDELRSSEVEVEDGKKEIKKGKIELSNAKRKLEKGETQYENGISQIRLAKSQYLYSLEGLAKEVGFRSPERMISSYEGKKRLKNYLYVANRELEQGLAEARMGIQEIENNLPNLKKQKRDIEEGLILLNQQLEETKASNLPEEEKAQIIAGILFEIERAKAGLQGTDGQPGLNQIIPDLEAKFTELQFLIPSLEAQQEEIPDFYFLLDAWNEILLGERELERAKKDLDQGYREYRLGLEELRDSESEIKNAESLLKEGKKEIEENEKKLKDAKTDLDKGLEELLQAKKDLDRGRKEYLTALRDLEDGRKEYEDGLIEIEEAKETLEDESKKAILEIKDGEKALQDGIEEYEDGLAQIEKAETEYNEGKDEAYEELNKAYDELLEAEDEIDDLEDPEWYVLDRDSNIGYASFQLNADKVAAIATVFPIFFYLVAGLVALTTMTRMVEEERTQIGLLKALGYKKTTIIFKYILYCGLASTLGSIFGQMVGFELIPRVIWNTYGVMYHLPEFITDYNQRIALVSSGVAILSTLAATFFAASDALREKPSLLMLPKAPKRGKRILLERITPLWSAMSFNLKSTARNIFRYKKHFYMTVIGVSGCTALLVTGFGIRDSIKDLGELQFDELFKYQLEIQLEDDYSKDVLTKISSNEDLSASLEIFSDQGYLEFEDEIEDISLVAIDDIDKVSDFILFRDRISGEVLDFDIDKIIITEKIADEFNIGEGDTIFYENSDEVKKEFRIDSITENYIGNYIYMEKNNYQLAFNENPANNSLYVKTEELDPDEEDKLIEDLYENDDITNAEFISQSRSIFDNLIESINYIVLVIIIASGLLAFIVLYNLTNININERRRELATLKVLGFYNDEVASYIFREVTVLALIGTFVGLVLGKYLHQFIILTIEDPNIMFGREISISSYIISAIITMIFSIIVDLFMIKKLRNIKMVDSMKAND